MIFFRGKYKYVSRSVLLVITAGLALSIAAFALVRHWEHEKLRKEFAEDAENLYSVLGRVLDSDLEVLSSIQAFFVHAKVITRTEFRDFTKPLLLKHTDIQSLEWIPKVPYGKRKELENAARTDGLKDFYFVEQKADGSLAQESVKYEYYPVYYVEPAEEVGNTLGFDLASNPLRKEDLDNARDSGQLVSTAKIKLQNKDGRYGFMVIAPVYGAKSLTNSITDRRVGIMGFALGIFRIADMVEKSLTYLSPQAIDVYLYDGSGPQRDSFLYHYSSSGPTAGTSFTGDDSRRPGGDLIQSKTIAVAGRQWNVLLVPGREYIANETTWVPWGVLSTGLILTGLLAGFLVIEGRRAKKHKLSNKRLGLTNERLLQEIDVRKQTEEELRLSEERFRSFFEKSPVGMVTVSPDFKILRPNLAFCEMLNYTEEELSGMSIESITYPADVEQSRKSFVQSLDGYPPLSNYEKRYVRKDNAVVWVNLSATSVFGKEGKVLYNIAIAANITERKQAEETIARSKAELAKQHEELRRVFSLVEVAKREWEKTMDCLDDMVILTDRQCTVKRCNRSFKDFLQIGYEQVLGRNCVDLFAGSGINIADAQSRETEIFSQATGRWFRIKSYPVHGIDGHNLYGSVITLHDITTIKVMTQKLEQTNREIEQAYSELKLSQAKILQQEKMASIGQLAAGVAHEINNPIGFVSSNLGSLDKYLEKILEYVRFVAESAQQITDPAVGEQISLARKRLRMDFVLDDAHKLVAESLDGTERVKTIVQNLKSFSRTDQADIQSADVNECIDTTLNIVWNELKYKTTVKKEYGTLPLTRCYPQQLNQVFMNLLVNAAQAIENYGEIRIRTWSTDGSIFASVTDTGCGIPPENIQKIFEPFFTTKEVGKGTGLGLSIVYDIVKKHNGEITVQSEIGKGTTFEVSIPVV